MRILVLAVVTLFASNALAFVDCRLRQFSTAAERDARADKDCTIGYAHDDDTFKLRANGSWASVSPGASVTGAQGGTWANSVNNAWTLGENSEDLVFTAGANLWTLSSSTAATVAFTPGVAFATALTLSDGLTIDQSANNVLTLAENSEDLELTFAANLVTFGSTTSATLAFTPALALADSLTFSDGAIIDQSANNVIGITENAEDITLTFAANSVVLDSTTSAVFTITPTLTLGAGAGGLTFTNSSASVLTIDNDTTALDIGSAGATTGLRYSSENNKEIFTFNAGMANAIVSMGGGNLTLDNSDCGKTVFVADADDTFTTTLPATIAGCQFTFMFKGTDGGALLDVSPAAADAVHGTCIGVGVVAVEFNGTDDNDVGFTKATINTGDTMTLIGDGVDGWYVTSCLGIAANN